MAAARYWARGENNETSDMDEAAAVFGLAMEQREPEHFKVDPDAWPAVLMFCRLSTQWRIGAGGPIGLDLNILPWLLTLEPADDPVALLDDLQTMEQAALQAMHERRD